MQSCRFVWIAVIWVMLFTGSVAFAQQQAVLADKGRVDVEQETASGSRRSFGVADLVARSQRAGTATAGSVRTTFMVTNTNDSGAGSLRQAMLDANASANGAQPDEIHFAIDAQTDPGCDSGTEVCTIVPTSQLPDITEAVIIDGETQQGADCGSKIPSRILKIELDGSGTPADTDGLRITSSGSTIRGLAINRFGGNNDGVGVRLTGAGAVDNVIECSFLGTDVTGTLDRGNLRGMIAELGASNNLIGGTAAEAGNLISGNDIVGVLIKGAGTMRNRVLGNYIGTNAAGNVALGNGISHNGGILIDNASLNEIGGIDQGAGNLISGNDQQGVAISGSGASGNKVLGNKIGTDITGTADLGNTFSGVSISQAPSNEIGGIDPGAGNLISGNDAWGVSISGTGATGNKVLGNKIGTDITGTAALGNTFYGVTIYQAPLNEIGGLDPGAGNLLSGNRNGVHISDTEAVGNKVLGNKIGTDITGTANLGNSAYGVEIKNASLNEIGGTATGAGNLISGGNDSGIHIFGPNATGNKVLGNKIGTDTAGTVDLGNTHHGVSISQASSNEIGGTAAGAGNLISGNNGSGVVIFSASATGNKVLGNKIGTDITGTADLGNSFHGVYIQDVPSNEIGGTAAGAGNLISGNNGSGVVIFSASATGNKVLGNKIGTDITGTADLGNTFRGVSISQAFSNEIGGTVAGAGNLISGNDRDGVVIAGPNATGNKVLGNKIGTDITGTADLGNTLHGVSIFQAPSNEVGGTAGGAGNLISGQDSSGVHITGADATGNKVLGNKIGTDITGTADLGNTSYGVIITDGSTMNTIGGTGVDEGNIIAFNGGRGVVVMSNTSLQNAILSNSIYQNALLGIDLAGNGVTTNDSGDPDTGPNNLQNFPDLTAAVIDNSGALLVTYLVDTDPASATYPLITEFFRADANDQEGEIFLGRNSYSTANHSGCGTPPCEATVNLGDAAALGVSESDQLVATATDDEGNTSEFSMNSMVIASVTRYVATDGSDEGNDCTDSQNPCATLSHAVGQANPGDTIDLAAGTYDGLGVLIEKALTIQGAGVVVE